MHSLFLLPADLLLMVSLVAAQSPAQCTRDGLSKLNNKLGQSPCTVKQQLLTACGVHNDTTSADCLCNTVTYNINAACAACDGQSLPTWDEWAQDNACAPNPAQFPSHAAVDRVMIPNWAYQNLTSNQDFNLAAAIVTDSPSGGRLSTAAQVAVPIAVAIAVAIVVCGFFYWYWSRKWRKHRNPRMKTLPLLPNEHGIVGTTRRCFQRVSWYLRSQQRPRAFKKDSNWEIDDDTRLLDQTRTLYDPYAPPPRVQSPDEEDRKLGAHSRQTSHTSILPHIDFPDVRVPTFVERFIKFKDGLRKSATYQAKYVSPISPDASFRIDGQESPVAKKFHTLAGFRSRPVAPEVAPQPVIAVSSELEPPPSENMDVLLISRNGDNFSMSLDDGATEAHGSPATARPPPSAYSGSRSTAGFSSLIPSPRRANTSSTLSGAYPHELRRDPDLALPPSWANKFPKPPSLIPGRARGAVGAGTAPRGCETRSFEPERERTGFLKSPTRTS